MQLDLQPGSFLFWILLVFFLSIIVLVKHRARQALPYRRRDRLMSKSEEFFLRTLRIAVGEMYDIYPQINLSRILYVKADVAHPQKFYNRIDRKSVDFLLCDKKTNRPILAIELDDASHFFAHRVRRDKFVDSTFGAAKMPLLHIPTQRAYDATQLKNAITACIN